MQAHITEQYEDKKELEDVESFVIEESSFAYYTKCHLPPHKIVEKIAGYLYDPHLLDS